MITIRRRLLFMLLPALAILMLAGGVADYWVAVASTRNAYDRALLNTALALATTIRVENQRLRFSALQSRAQRKRPAYSFFSKSSAAELMQ